MRISLLIIFSLLIFSCASVETKNSLFDSYKKYGSTSNKKNIASIYSDFFSHDLLGSENISDPEVIDQLLFKDLMAKYHSHYEEIYGEFGCLTINGYDNENGVVAFNLKYILRGEDWLIREIHIFYPENESDLSNTAKCPGDYNQ